jgi:DNA replication protein DnaC
MSATVEVRPALTGHLKELRLPTVRQCYEETARRAERETLSYEQYLLEVITRECEQRRKTRVQRLLRESELPLEKSLPNFDVKRLPTKAQRQMRTLLEGDFLNRKQNVLVFGRPGSGKSHLLTALAQELIVMRERRMHFTKCSLLMQDLLAAKRDLRLSREIKRLGRFEGLIIDDLGYLQQSRDDMDVVFTLLAERYERGSVLMTSNLAFSKWEGIFKDAVMTAAAIDRLVHHSVIIELNIPAIGKRRPRRDSKWKGRQRPQEISDEPRETRAGGRASLADAGCVCQSGRPQLRSHAHRYRWAQAGL